jgi:hypothetical protein
MKFSSEVMEEGPLRELSGIGETGIKSGRR